MHRVFHGRVDVSRPVSEHPWAAEISGSVLLFPMCDDSWFRRKRDSFRYWLWRRRWSTLTESRMAEIIAEIAPRYAVKFIAFKTSGSDGIIRPEDTLDVYVVNNGGMSYSGLVFFCGDMRCVMNRDADFHPMEHSTERSELIELGLNIAYEGPVMPDTDTSPVIRLNDPPGINPGLIRRAVDIVVETCSPRLVYLVGPTSVGYVEQGRVELVVVVDKGNKKALQNDITWALTDYFIDGEVSLYTSKEFEECREDSWTSAYRAAEYGRIAYERGSAKQPIDSGNAFIDHAMRVAPRAGCRNPHGLTILPADWDDPQDAVYSAMEADEKGITCILDEGIIGAVFEEAIASGKTLFLSRICTDRRIQLKIPLPVDVSHGTDWVVSVIGLPVHGSGDTPIEALEDTVSVFVEALELFCGPEVPLDDPTKTMFATYVRFDE